MCITSVERIKEYVDLPCEEKRPSRDDQWLQHGAIRFNKVSAKYKPHLPPAIQKISFVVKPGRRVGICGRSGSGKSTLLGVLWRLIEFEDDGGEITVDGVDIRDLQLRDYRGAMSIVPQGMSGFVSNAPAY
jgi:ABC-type multidrug transport system fused ATPase/permease subunit